MITLRDATLDDLSLLRHWDSQPHIIACDPDSDWQWEIELNRNPGWRKQLVAELDGRAIGFIQIIDPALEDSHYWGEIENGFRAIDIWIGETDCLGKGYGTQMMQQALQRCFAVPEVHTVLIDPLTRNTAAQRFYQRIGFNYLGQRQFGDDHCTVYKLHRQDFLIGVQN